MFDSTNVRRGLAACLLAMCGTTATAQGVYPPADTFPDLRLEVAGTVNAIVKYNDGVGDFYLIGGDFDLVNGMPRRNLARLNADGTLDAAWEADTDGTVNALALSGDDLFVGGAFATVDGASRANLAMVDADDGVVDANWSPMANNTVNALQTDGTSVWAGGLFTTVDGMARRMVARIVIADASLPAFNANVTGSAVFSLLVDGNDLYIGGAGKMKSAGNQRALVKVNATTGAAIAWNPGIGPQGGSRIRALAMDGTTVYAVGRIRRAGGNNTRGNGARFLKSDASLQAWNPGADAEIRTLALDAGSSAVFVGGDFLNLAGHIRLARTDATSGAASGTWNANADRSVAALIVDGASNLIAGGGFAQIGAIAAQGGLSRLAIADGAIDATFMGDAAGPGYVTGYAFDADGGVIIGGAFDAARQDGEVILYPRQNIVRLVPGDLVQQPYEIDRTWAVNVFGEVNAVAVDGADLYVGGNFSSVGGIARTRLAKLTAATGVLDATWLPTADAPVRHFALDGAASRLYVAGDFLTIGGASRAGVAVLATTGAGSADATWNPAPDDVVDVLLPSGSSVYAGGSFATIGGLARVGLARLDNVAGAADPGFSADVDSLGAVHALAETGDGLYVGGLFATLQGAARGGTGRIAPAGTVDAWNPDVGGGDVHAIAIDSVNGHAYIGGTFTTAGSMLHPNLARASVSGTGAVDHGWRPGTDGAVVQMSVPADGEVLAAGAFSLVTGDMRNGIAKLGMQGSDSTQITIDSITPVGGTAGTDTTFGQSYTVAWTVANVTDPGTPPTGTVTITTNSGEGCGPVNVTAGSCTVATPAGTGARNVTATFSGDALFLDAAATVAHTVVPATIALTVSTSPNPSLLNATADANITFAVQAPGAGAPTGTVTVTVNGGAGCSIVLPATTCQLPAFTAFGFYAIAATYADSAAPANFTAAAANATHAVGTVTTVDLSLPANALVGSAVTASVATTNIPDGSTVTVTGGNGCAISITANAGSCQLTFGATGNVQVTAAFAGSNEFLPSQDQASVTVDPPLPTTTTLDVSFAPVAPVVGQAITVSVATNLPDGSTLTIAGAPGCTQLVTPNTCGTSYAAPGPITITATFAGNGAFTAANDTANGTVAKAATAFTAFAAGATVGVPNDSIAFTWTVAAVAPGAGVPTGTVRVSVDGNGTAPSCTAAVSAGGCSVVFPAEGTFAMRADYQGDANFDASLSAAESINIVQAAPTDTDLLISKTVSRSRLDLANGIEKVEFMLVVGNAGPAAVTGASIADTLPVSLTGATWTCVPDDAGASCSVPNGSGNVALTATLPANTTVTVLVQADVSPNAPVVVANTATVAAPAGGNDPSLSNNTSTAHYQACAANSGPALVEHFCTFRDGFEGQP